LFLPHFCVGLEQNVGANFPPGTLTREAPKARFTLTLLMVSVLVAAFLAAAWQDSMGKRRETHHNIQCP
jgi:hypothetical protein